MAEMNLNELTALLYFEDFNVGDFVLSHTRTLLTKEDIIDFAKRYDPQPFHTDEEAAKDSFFNGLAASGWHTAVIGMRQFVDTLSHRVAGGLVGVAIDKMRWVRPVRPGDNLTVRVEFIGKKRSKSKPNFGTVQLSWAALDEQNEAVMTLEAAIWVPLKSPDAPLDEA